MVSENTRSLGPGHRYTEATAKDRGHQLNGDVNNVELLKAFLAPQYGQETTVWLVGYPLPYTQFGRV